MPKISVIVPVYNVKDYLEKCVSSVLAQTEGDFELLLIDDGSTDGSGALCDELTARDERIRVIHQENQGLGGARNTGIRASAGDWLLLLDSDDWLDPETLARTVSAGEKSGGKLVVFGLRSVDEQGRILRELTEDLPKEQLLPIEASKNILLILPSAANKLYRRELFTESGVQFPPRVWYEDIRTTPKLLALAGGAVFSGCTGYNYLQRGGSIMRNSNVERNGEILDAFDDLLGWFRDRGLFEEYREELGFLCLYHAYLTASVRVLRIDSRHSLLKRFAAYLAEHFPDYRQNKYLSRLTRNERLIFRLLEHRRYWLIALIFKIK